MQLADEDRSDAVRRDRRLRDRRERADASVREHVTGMLRLLFYSSLTSGSDMCAAEDTC